MRIPIRFNLPPDASAGAVAAQNPAYPGYLVELNCRYRDGHVDDCSNAQSAAFPSEAVRAATDLVQKMSLPQMARPAGRILLPVRFAGDVPPPLGQAITAPRWIRRPTGGDLASVIPRAAYAGIDGEAVTSCTVTRNGDLVDCVTVSEAPLGAGFGAAALKLMPRFKMTPMTADGKTVEGGTVRIPIRFTAPR